MMSELSITTDDLERFGPCYDDERLDALMAFSRTRERWTWREIAAAEQFPAADRLWLLLRPELIPDVTLRLLACDFAERGLNREREAGREPDPRSWAAIAVSRRYAHGEAAEAELNAARDAAREAAWDAAREAAWAAWAAREAAWAASWPASWPAGAAAGAAELVADDDWQLARLVEVMDAAESETEQRIPRGDD